MCVVQHAGETSNKGILRPSSKISLQEGTSTYAAVTRSRVTDLLVTETSMFCGLVTEQG